MWVNSWQKNHISYSLLIIIRFLDWGKIKIKSIFQIFIDGGQEGGFKEIVSLWDILNVRPNSRIGTLIGVDAVEFAISFGKLS